MSGRSMTGFLTLNRNLTTDVGGGRTLQLPRMNPFPKLDRRVALAATEPVATVGTRHSPSRCGMTVIADVGPLPEMTTDVIDEAANFPVENVRRTDSRMRGPWSRAGFGQLVGRMLGHR